MLGGSRVEQTRVLGRTVGRSRWGGAEAEIGSQLVSNSAETGVEMADAGSLHSRRRVVTGGFGRLAADRKAPRKGRLANSSLFSARILPARWKLQENGMKGLA